MDLDEWELLPDDGFLEINDDGGKKIFSRKYGIDQKSVFRMNYFSPNSPKSEESPKKISRVPNQIVPVPIFQLEQPMKKPKDDHNQEINKNPIEIKLLPPMLTDQITDQDMVSQVFFKKENEFVDMKMDSPRSGTRGVVPQIDVGAFQFEGKKDEDMESNSFASNNLKDEESNCDDEESDNGGLNIWKWSLTGVGAICSFGVAAATICIIVFGGNHRNKQQIQKNHKFRFQIYTDDKRIKQVVQHANKLNDAISIARGVPLSRAQITCGGYYDGL